MKIFTFLLLFLVISSFDIFAQTAPTDLDFEMLSGKVKRIDEEVAEVKIKDGVRKEGQRNRSRTLIFDKDGLKTYEWIKIDILQPTELYYTYDKGKRFTRYVSSGFMVGAAKPFESYSVTLIVYKPNENAVYEMLFRGRNPDFKSTPRKDRYLFDDQKRLTNRYSYDESITPILEDKYIFGAARLPTEQQIIASSNPSYRQIIKYEYVLDDKNNWTKRTEDSTAAGDKAEKRFQITYRKIVYYK